MKLELEITEVENGYMVCEGHILGQLTAVQRKIYVASTIQSLLEVIEELATEASQTDDVKKFRESGI